MTIVQEIGAYAGFAAVVGLAVLSALYFSQARDVKRLREWAGRAPERAAEQEARIRAANQAPAAQPAQAAQAAQQRTAVAAQGGGPAVAPPPSPGPPTAVQSPQSRPPVPTTSAFRPGPGPGTGPILAGARPGDPWYRRIHWPEPKYIALIVAGVLILGGGAAYGVKQLTSDSGNSTAPVTAGKTGEAAGGKKSSKRSGAQVNPADIRVSVLNGTSVTGQASKLADQLENKGYQRGTVANASGDQGQRAESVVEYSDGNVAAARAVGRELGITQFEKADPTTQQLAGDAQVIVILGADRAAATG